MAKMGRLTMIDLLAAVRLPRGQLEHGPGGWRAARWALAHGAGNQPPGRTPGDQRERDGRGAARDRGLWRKWPRRGPEGEPRVGGGACPPAGIGAAPAAGRDGAGPPQAAGRGWQMDDSPGRSPRTTDSSDERRERVCGVGDQATSIPPTPAPNKGAAELAKRAHLEKTAGDGGDERQRRRPRSPNEGGRGHRIAARSAELPSTTARHEGDGIQLAGRWAARCASAASGRDEQPREARTQRPTAAEAPPSPVACLVTSGRRDARPPARARAMATRVYATIIFAFTRGRRRSRHRRGPSSAIEHLFAGRTLHGGRRTPVCRTHVARRASNTCLQDARCTVDVDHDTMQPVMIVRCRGTVISR